MVTSLPCAVDGKVAGPRIGRGAIRHQDFEKALPLDGEVVIAARTLERTLHEGGRRRACAHAQTDLHSRRQRRVCAGLRAGFAQLLIDHVLEIGTAFFEADGIGVRKVVGDDIEAELLGGKPTGGGKESAIYNWLSSEGNPARICLPPEWA